MKIYEPQGRAREYSPLALNIKRGCSHSCLYCYVPQMFLKYNKSYVHSQVTANTDFLILEKSAKKLMGCNKQILLSFTGDPYCGVSPETTSKSLEILLKYQHKVAILTKGGSRCLKDLEIFKKYGNSIKVGATLTFDNVKDSYEWECNAAIPSDRIDTLRILKENGIRTWVSFEPVIFPNQTLNLLEIVSDFIDEVKVGKINNYKNLDKNIDWNSFIRDVVSICRNKEVPFYIKKDLLIFNEDTKLNTNETDQDYLNIKDFGLKDDVKNCSLF